MNKKIVKLVVALVVVIALIAAGAFLYTRISRDINGTESGEAKEYTLVIEPQDFQYEISKMLSDNDIVVDDSIWSMWMDSHYPDITDINGEDYLSSNMSSAELAQ